MSTTVTVRPTSTIAIGAGYSLVGGGGTAHATTSDNSDSTYISGNNGATGGVRMAVATPTIPAGSTILGVTARVKAATASSGHRSQIAYCPGTTTTRGTLARQAMTATALATFTGPLNNTRPDGQFWTIADMSSLALWFDSEIVFDSTSNTNVDNPFHVAEVYIDVVYDTPPAATITAPASSSTSTTDRFAVTWTYADPEGEVQAAYRVKVWDQATQAGAGFDPEVTPPAWDSGVVTGAATTTTVGDPLINGSSYAVGVKVSDGYNFGAWSFHTAVLISVSPPLPPSLVATPSAATASVALAIIGVTTENALSANDAQLTTTLGDWAAVSGCTVARDGTTTLDAGTGSLKYTASGTAAMVAETGIGASGVTVLPGSAYRGRASFLPSPGSAPTPILSDTYARSVAAKSWGTPDTGVAYVNNTGPGSWQVNSGTAVITSPASNGGQNGVYWLPATTVSQFTRVTSFAASALVAATAWTSFRFRVNAGKDTYYDLRVQFDNTGAGAKLVLRKIWGGGSAGNATISTVTTAVVPVAGTRYDLQIVVSGTSTLTVKAYFWIHSGSAPGTPQMNVTTTDTDNSNALQAPGGFGVNAQGGTGNTTAITYTYYPTATITSQDTAPPGASPIRRGQVAIEWFDTSNASIGLTPVGTVTEVAGTWEEALTDGIAPASAIRAALRATVLGVAVAGAGVKAGLATSSTTEFADMQTATGATLLVERVFHSDVGQMPNGRTTAAIAVGRTPILSFKVQGLTWAQVTAGNADTAINAAIARLAAVSPQPATWYMTFHHEPDQSTNASFGTAADYIAAWQHVHDLFVAAGLPTTWTSIITSGGCQNNVFSTWYPGDAYVDIVGSDNYNKGSIPGNGLWLSMATISANLVTFAAAHSKPAAWPEWGCAEDPADATRRANWLTAAWSYAKANGFSFATYYDEYDSTHGWDWRLPIGSASQQAWSTGAVDAQTATAPLVAAEVHYLDQAGIQPGAPALWSAGGVTVTNPGSVEIQRSSDNGTTWLAVRNGTIALQSAMASVVDAGAPLRAPLLYRARVTANSGPNTVTGDWTTVATSIAALACWLKDPLAPADNVKLMFETRAIATRHPSVQGVHFAVGRTDPIVVEGVHYLPSLTLQLHFPDDLSYGLFVILWRKQRTLLFQSCYGDTGSEQWYVRLGPDLQVNRISTVGMDAAQRREVTISAQAVARP